MAGRKSTDKKEKKERGPKRALTAYMFFASDKRKQIIAEHPDLKSNIGTVGKMIGAEWQKLTEAQKAPYVKQQEKDKARYEAEKKKTVKAAA